MIATVDSAKFEVTVRFEGSDIVHIDTLANPVTEGPAQSTFEVKDTPNEDIANMLKETLLKHLERCFIKGII